MRKLHGVPFIMALTPLVQLSKMRFEWGPEKNVG